MTGEEAESIDERSSEPLQASTTDRTVDILQEVARAYLARLDGVPVGDIEVDVPFWHDLAVEQAARLRAEARSSGGGGESDDGRSDRPGLSGALSRGADILLEVVRAQPGRHGGALPLDGEHADRWALESIKTLLTAGWSAPEERTIGIPNGLVLHPGQWQDLAAGRSTWIITPGGDQALELTTTSSQSPPSAEVLESLWLYRELTRTTEWGKPTEMRYDPRDVTVPRSFLTFLVQLTRELRWSGDYAAANSLDNSLAVIAPELREAKIPWEDGGGVTPASPERLGRTRERDAFGVRELRTHTATNYFTQLQNAARAYAEALQHSTIEPPFPGGLAGDTWLDIVRVLRYVSGGSSYARAHFDKYPDHVARRALGQIEDAHDAVPTPGGRMPTHPVEVDDVVVQKIMDAFAARYPHLATATTSRRTYQPLSRYEELGDALAEARREIANLKSNLTTARERDDYGRVRTELFPIVAEHPLTRAAFTDFNESEVWVGFVVQQAARLLYWYETELTRVRRELVDEKRNLQHARGAQEDLRHELNRSRDDNQRTKDALLTLVSEHPHTLEDVVGIDPMTIRAGHVAEHAARLLAWYADELVRVKRELGVDVRRYSASGWARVEGMHLIDHVGWEREKLDPDTPITRTQFLELAELCEWERVGTSVHDDIDPTEQTTDHRPADRSTANTDGDAPEWTIS